MRRWWKKGLAASRSVNMSYVPSLIAHAREAGYNRGAKRPGMEDYEHNRPKRVVKVLGDLEDGGDKHAFPLLYSMVGHIRDTMDDSTTSKRNLGLTVIACIAALRGQDHNAGRLRKRNLVRIRGQGPHAWSRLVMPGKAHGHVAPAMLSSIMPEAERDELKMDPGKIVSELWELMGLEDADGDVMLFAEIRLGEVRHGEHANDDECLEWLRDMLLKAGYPADIMRRITLHSPRSGAATDWFAAGVRLEVIEKQGRWRSDAVLLYLRLLLLSVGQWMAQVLKSKQANIAGRADDGAHPASRGHGPRSQQEAPTKRGGTPSGGNRDEHGCRHRLGLQTPRRNRRRDAARRWSTYTKAVVDYDPLL